MLPPALFPASARAAILCPPRRGDGSMISLSMGAFVAVSSRFDFMPRRFRSRLVLIFDGFSSPLPPATIYFRHGVFAGLLRAAP